MKKAMAQRRRELEEEMTEQTLTPEKVATHSRVASTGEAQHEKTPPLSEVEKQWAKAIDKKAVQQFTAGIVDDILTGCDHGGGGDN